MDTDCTEVTDFSVTNGRKSVQSVYEKKAWFDFKKAVNWEPLVVKSRQNDYTKPTNGYFPPHWQKGKGY